MKGPYRITESASVPDQWYISRRHWGIWWIKGVRSGLVRAVEFLADLKYRA